MKPRFPFAVLIGLIVHLAGTPLQANISARTVVTPWPRHSRGGRVGARHAQIIPSEAKCSSPPIFLHEVASIFCPDQENRGRSRAGPCSRSPSCWTASGCRVPSARASTVRSSKCRSNASSGPNTSARMLRDHHPSRSVLWGGRSDCGRLVQSGRQVERPSRHAIPDLWAWRRPPWRCVAQVAPVP